MFVIQPIGRLIKRAALYTQILSAVTVFVVLAAFTIVSWQNARQTLQTEEDGVIQEKVRLIEDSVEDHMQTCEMLLKGAAGLFAGSDEVTRSDWQAFFAGFNVSSTLPGVSSAGYAPVVSQANAADFTGMVRQQGAPDFTIAPGGTRDTYAPVIYAERFQPTFGSFGYDMYAEPTRRAALERARDTGKITMTPLIKLNNNTVPGVILAMPIYKHHAPTSTVAERQAAIQGYTYLAFRTNELFTTIVQTDRDGLNFSVKDTNPGGGTDEVFSSLPASQRSKIEPASADSVAMNLYGQTWHVQTLKNHGAIPGADEGRPLRVLITGLVLAFVAGLAVYFSIQYRAGVFAIEEERKLQQAKDELLSLASHQLRTPATGVKQYLGMVLEGFSGAVSKNQKSLLGQAYKSNERQLQIINEFLYVAKLGAGSLTTTVHAFDLVPLLKDVTNEMKGEIKEKGHKLTVTAPKSLIINADEHSVRMIIENLLSNAIKYTPQKGTLTVTLKKGRIKAHLSVTDTGIGIAKKDMSLLFKQFSRVPNELSRSVSGSGIGLYLSEQLASRNGGEIRVESEPDVGSTFTLVLPIKSVRNITRLSKKSVL